MVPGTEQLAGCVLWHDPDQGPAPELLAALGRKRIDVMTASDRFAALAQACRVRDRGGVVVVLLHEPDVLYAHFSRSMVAEFLDAVVLYVPASTVWAYEAARSPELRAFDDTELGPEVGVVIPREAPAPVGAWGKPGGATSRSAVERARVGGKNGAQSGARNGAPGLRLVEAPDGADFPDAQSTAGVTYTQPDPLLDAGRSAPTARGSHSIGKSRSGEWVGAVSTGPELTDEELAALLGLDRSDSDAPDTRPGLGAR